MILNNVSITEIEGTLHTKDLFINPGSILRIKGNLIVDGDQHLKGNLDLLEQIMLLQLPEVSIKRMVML